MLAVSPTKTGEMIEMPLGPWDELHGTSALIFLRHLKKTGTDSKYINFDVINDVTSVRILCCLLSFGIFHEDKICLF